ncbi:MAG: hypothetical protein PWP24_1652 [Clostridiales bacterium]|nr:hypothetical protein [Clostridiales bacterium]
MSDEGKRRPIVPFSFSALIFLEALSKKIRGCKEAASYPDLLTFSFYCRRANLETIKNSYDGMEHRLGRGLLFHIAPSNVPINFAYSYVFGLLAGNENVVRVSTKDFPQVDLLCRLMEELFMEPAFEEIGRRTRIIRYDRSQEINDYFSSICNGRIIWGGDETIQQVRRSPLPVRSIEITFADRYSLGIVSPKAILSMDEEAITQLARDFYNDTYLMDQNACTTPHLIVWKVEEELARAEVLQAKNRFWESIYKQAERYDLADIKVSEKYELLCELACEKMAIQEIKQYGNRLYRISLSSLFVEGRTMDITQYRGSFGLFFEAEIKEYAELLPHLFEKVQTIATKGVDPQEIRDFIETKGVMGVDRIVPFGKTLDIGTIWDGYDLIRTLSRVITVVER